MTERFQRISDIFQRVCDLPLDERSLALDLLCADDQELRREVESLLSEDDDPILMARSLAAPGIRDAIEKAQRDAASSTTGGSVGTQDELAPGTLIGDYRIDSKIGHGGFGIVYLAEQQRPVLRRVAIKVLRGRIASRHVMARFELERQALAVMKHPGIAQIFDAGTTTAGVPYFVMEFVDGDPLVDHCDRAQLTVRDRLRLFIGVSRAVFHAHQKGIIHRDLKPSNILVTEVDGQPAAKIIDFGIAKAVTDADDDDNEPGITRDHQLVGTPQYMSPEQARGRLQALDTRSDIYSLGVILYELLIGTTPFDRDALRRAGVGGIRDLLIGSVPPKPSTRLRGKTNGGAKTSNGHTTTIAAIAASRNTDSASLRRLLRGDLDWIAMKAIDREPDRRYQTAAGLADDVERHLRGDAVLASPAGVAYVARKFVRRHMVGVAATVAVLIALLGGVLAIGWGAAQARESATRAESMNEFMTGVLSAPVPDQSGADVRLIDVLDRAAEDAEVRFADDPEQMAFAQALVGRVMSRQAMYPKALEVLTSGYETAKEAYGNDDPRTLDTGGELLFVIGLVGRSADVLTLAEELLPQQTRVLGPDHVRTIDCERIGIRAQARIDGFVNVEEPQRELLERARRDLGPDHSVTANVLGDLAVTLNRLGGAARLREAVELLRESHRIAVAKHGLGSEEHLGSLAILAQSLARVDSYEEALELALQGLEDSEGHFSDLHSRRTGLKVTAALALYQLRRVDEATPYAIDAVESAIASHGEPHPFTLSIIDQVLFTLYYSGACEEGARFGALAFDGCWRRPFPNCLIYAGWAALCQVELGRHDEALETMSMVITESEEFPRPFAPAFLEYVYAETLLATGRTGEARSQLEEAMEAWDDPVLPRLGFDSDRIAELLAEVCETLGDEQGAADARSRLAERRTSAPGV